MALLDVTSWQTGNQKWVPIGKRIKNVVLHPDNFDMYYFKEPKEKYPWEFWMEIIASAVGKDLGFNTLEYTPAVMDNIGGCLSKSMTQKATEELIHGQQYLIRILPEFELKKGTDHTFQLIEEFFKSDDRVVHLMDQFIEMLIFDAIVGNRDRHQQNWAIIREIKVMKERISFSQFLKRKEAPKFFDIVANFSPLFDNGNCLAYNIVEDDISNLLESEDKLDKYLFGAKAVSHVRWFGGLLPHIELLIQIEKNYPAVVKNVIKSVAEKYNAGRIADIVNTIDNDIIFANPIYNLSEMRKKLVIKLLQIRIEKLMTNFKYDS